MNLVPVGKRSLTRAIRAARRGSSRGGMAGEHHEHKNAPGIQARCAGIHHVHRLARLCGAAIDRPVAYHRLAQGHGKTCAVSGHYPAQALRGVFALRLNPVDGVKRPMANGNEGSTPALGDQQARKLLEAPPADTPKGVHDRAILELCTRPFFAMTNASPLTARRRKRSMPRRRTWQPSSWRNLRHVRPRKMLRSPWRRPR
jgi:hypothetical protein